jgi:uncharacterized membrane protein
MSSPARRFSENASSIVSVLITGIWLGALFTGQGWWLPFMLVGYVAIVPLVAILFDEDETEEAGTESGEQWEQSANRQTEYGTGEASDRGTEQTSEDALQTLRDRYARGELTDQQFERKLERLLETETIEDAEDRLRRSKSRKQEPEIETELE